MIETRCVARNRKLEIILPPSSAMSMERENYRARALGMMNLPSSIVSRSPAVINYLNHCETRIRHNKAHNITVGG